jgi:2-oxoglutarate dehydrogenase E2 component (dihydrolipoamide succinyltransferase)
MSDLVEVRAPAEQTEGTRSQVLRWLKSVGDQVSENEPLIEIETDKVTVEVAAPGSGVLHEILRHEQDEIGPGELLGRIQGSGAATRGAAPVAGAVAGLAQPSAASPGAAAAGGPAPMTAAAKLAGDQGATASLSPAVRRLLGQHGLEASSVRGTGQGARITVEDVLRHAAAAPAAGAAPGASRTTDAPSAARGAPAVAIGTTPTASRATGISGSTEPDTVGAFRRVPHSAVRRRIAEHMVQSLLHAAPHVTSVFEADLTAVLAHRERHREEFARHAAPLTLTAYFLQAAVVAIRAVPEANSRWTDTALEIFDAVHIGVATALDTGLVVPVLRDVQSRDLLQTAQGLADLTSRARDGRLTPADMRGGTFTLSNHGVSGSLLAAPIVINLPQAAILGIGKLEKRAVVVDGGAERPEGRIVIQPRCYVTLTIDHRVMDGQQANRFLQTFVQRLETSPP